MLVVWSVECKPKDDAELAEIFENAILSESNF